jgi:phosphatidylinositol glycan class N
MNKVNTEPRIFGYTYPGHIEKTGQDMSKLNIWVFDHLKEVLYQAALNDEKLNSDGLLFLVHLPGGDHIGHMFKPHSNRFASKATFVKQLIC